MEVQTASRKKTCFVIMPIGKDGSVEARKFKDIYDVIIKEAVDDPDLGYECIRADEVQRPDTIIKDIGRRIRDADVVIADLTGRNANVFYELGVRHALQGKTILLTQDLGEVPFDLQGQRLIVYTPSEPRSVADAKKRIKGFLKGIESDQLSHSPIAEIVAERPPSDGSSQPPPTPELASLRQAVENVTYALSEHMLKLGDQIRDSVGEAVKDSFRPREMTTASVERLAVLNTLNACGISNVYERRTDAYERIVSLIQDPRERVDLMGVSLRRFFHNDTEINAKIKRLKNYPIEWRVLCSRPGD